MTIPRYFRRRAARRPAAPGRALRPRRPLALALPPGAPAAWAQGFEQVSFDRRSDSDRLIDEPRRVREFATAAGFTVAPARAGDRVWFEHRVAWMAAHRVEPGLPFTVLSFGNTVACDLRLSSPFLSAGCSDADVAFADHQGHFVQVVAQCALVPEPATALPLAGGRVALRRPQRGVGAP